MDERAKRSRAVWEKAVLHNLSEVEEEQALTNREFTLHLIRMQDSLGSQEKLDINQVLKLYEEAISIDPRNVLAYYDLARNYLVENSLDKAEFYCQKGYEVKDIPSEITKAPSWLNDIHEEVNQDFDFLMMMIRLKQGRVDEAREYLRNLKSYFDKYSKGNYGPAREIFDKYAQAKTGHPAKPQQAMQQPQKQAVSKGGCSSVIVFLSVLLLLLIFVLR